MAPLNNRQSLSRALPDKPPIAAAFINGDGWHPVGGRRLAIAAAGDARAPRRAQAAIAVEKCSVEPPRLDQQLASRASGLWQTPWSPNTAPRAAIPGQGFHRCADGGRNIACY